MNECGERMSNEGGYMSIDKINYPSEIGISSRLRFLDELLIDFSNIHYLSLLD